MYNTRAKKNEMILKDKVLSYITDQGTSVTMEMLEKEFGESRLRLGYILNMLLTENKICKSDHHYRVNDH